MKETILHYGLQAAEKKLREVLKKDEFLMKPPTWEPVYIVTPTKAVKEQLFSRLQSLGVEVMNLYQFASFLVSSTERPLFYESPLFPLVVRDACRYLAQRSSEVAQLNQTLGEFIDSYDGLTQSIRELFSAGFQVRDEEVLLEFLTGEYQVPLFASPWSEESVSIGEQQRRKASAVISIASLVFQVMTKGRSVMSRQHTALKDCNIGLAEAIFLQATTLLQTGDIRPPTRVIFYGFSDAGGLQSRFIEAVSQGSEHFLLFLIKVRDPAFRSLPVEDASNLIIDDFQNRQLFLPIRTQSAQPSQSRLPSKYHYEAAIGFQKELRSVFERARSLLETGISPEEICLVCNSWEAYRPFFRSESQRISFPYHFTTPLRVSSHRSRRMDNFLQLLAQRDLFSIHTFLSMINWRVLEDTYRLDSVEERLSETHEPILQERVFLRSDLQLYFQALGMHQLSHISILSQLVASPLEDSTALLSIPAIDRMSYTQKDGCGVYNAKRRKVSALLVQNVARLIQRILTLLETVYSLKESNDRVFLTHVTRLWETLGWSATCDEVIAIHAAVEKVSAAISSYGRCDVSDYVQLLGKELSGFGTEALGFEYGVPCMRIDEAAGLQVKHLFLLGMNKGTFPSPFQEDPLLTESIRGRLLSILPDLLLRSEKYMAQRYQLYRLIGGCENVYFSWLLSDEQGKSYSVSPLIRRILLQSDEVAQEENQRVQKISEPALPLPLFERIQMAGLQGNHFALTEAWKVYAQFFWRDLFPELPEDRVNDLLDRAVQGRVDTVRELYPPLNSRAYRRLGPYSGLTGLGPHCGIYPGDDSDNLTSPLSHLELDQASFITGIEQFIGCPWQNFLNRMLRAEKTENAEMILPRVQANVLGNVVHNILEGIVKEQDPNPHIDTLKEKLEYDTFSLSWPQESHLYALFNQEAQKQLQMDKQIWATKSDVIIDIVLPYLQVERELEFSSPKKCLGAELEGCFFVLANAEGGRPVDSGSDRLNIWSSSQERIRIRGLFKADRVDRSGDVLQMLDYKTGSVLSTKKKEADRAKEFRSSITKGQKLQPLAYAASLPYYQSLYPEIQAAQGSLVFISPKQDYPQRIFSIDSNDEEELSLLARAAWTSGVAKIIGVHLPRLVRTKSKRDRLGPDHFQGNRWCTNCDYQSACRIGDTAFRRRLITVCEESNQEEVAEALPGNVSERLQEWTSFLIGKVWRIGRGS